MYWGTVFISVWNVVFIVVERFVIVNHTYEHRNMRPTHIAITFIIMYIFSIICLLPEYLYQEYEKSSGQCARALNDIMKYYGVFWFSVFYAIPITVLITLYVKIILYLQQNQETLGEVLKQRSSTLDIADQQVMKTTIAVTIVFALSIGWAAFYRLLDVVGVTRPYVNDIYQVIGVFLATLNSCATPIIYVTSMPIFRSSLKKTVMCTNDSEEHENDESVPSITSETKQRPKQATMKWVQDSDNFTVLKSPSDFFQLKRKKSSTRKKSSNNRRKKHSLALPDKFFDVSLSNDSAIDE
jgi:hypothetical protein